MRLGVIGGKITGNNDEKQLDGTTIQLQSFLYIYQLIENDLFHCITDILHRPDPGHLISDLQLLGDALRFCHLLGEHFHLRIGCLVDLIQVIVQFANENRSSKACNRILLHL